jgi:class 3 adenylate cyclase
VVRARGRKFKNTGRLGTHPGARFVGALLFSEILDSTLVAEVQGDAAWIHVLDQHDAAIDRDVARFGGRIINHTGDGILGVSDAPGQAVQCALSLHQSIAEIGLKVHIGVIDRRGHDFGGDRRSHRRAREPAAAITSGS